MNTPIVMLLCSMFFLPLSAQQRRERKSLLHSDPSIIHLTDLPDMQIDLQIIKNAPIFSDINAKSKVGEIRANQKVRIEAITDRAYKVRGKGLVNDVSGWVGPSAFASKDPNFIENLKKFHKRKLEVNKCIADKKVALGMTTEEVTESLGSPKKSTLRQDKTGQSGKWEYIEYDQQNNYNTIQDPVTGQVFRQLVSVTQIEKNKKAIEFTNGVVSAIEDTEDKAGGSLRIVIPPVVFCW
jgi:hypothetical protein